MTILKAITEICKERRDHFKPLLDHPCVNPNQKIVNEFNRMVSNIINQDINAHQIFQDCLSKIKWAEVRVIQQIVVGDSIRNAAYESRNARRSIIGIIKKFEKMMEDTKNLTHA